MVVADHSFLFGAGQETVTKLLSSAVQVLSDRPELQDRVRADRKLIGPFIEEALRMQSPTKVDFRLTRKSTTLGGVPIKAGTVIMLCLGAANRDPRKFEEPNEFRLDRKNVREHIALGEVLVRTPGRRWPESRAGSRSTGCWTEHVTYPSARQSTDPPTTAIIATRQPSYCADSASSTSNSRQHLSSTHPRRLKPVKLIVW